MNKEHKDNLNKMADYLDGGPNGRFVMFSVCDCVIGHSLRLIEGRTGNWAEWAFGATLRLFGISQADEDWDRWCFCFGGNWPNDPHLAAARLRYVALHGDAPSKDQWKRFEVAQEAVEAEVKEAELAEACA